MCGLCYLYQAYHCSFFYTLSLPLVLLNECQPSSAVPKVGVLPLNRARSYNYCTLVLMI